MVDDLCCSYNPKEKRRWRLGYYTIIPADTRILSFLRRLCVYTALRYNISCTFTAISIDDKFSDADCCNKILWWISEEMCQCQKKPWTTKGRQCITQCTTTLSLVPYNWIKIFMSDSQAQNRVQPRVAITRDPLFPNVYRNLCKCRCCILFLLWLDLPCVYIFHPTEPPFFGWTTLTFLHHWLLQVPPFIVSQSNTILIWCIMTISMFFNPHSTMHDVDLYQGKIMKAG